MIKKALQTAVPIVEAAEGAAFILVAPTPRYVTRKCCDNPGHIDNFGGKDYEKEIMAGIDQHIQSINNWATELGLDYYILDPKSSGDSFVDSLRGRTSTCGKLLWDEEDAVHLTLGGYRDIAGAIRGLKELIDEKDEAGEEGLVSTETSSSTKRARLDSVVTRPPAPSVRPGDGRNQPHKMASWLLGKNAPPGKGYSERTRTGWRGRSGFHGAGSGAKARGWQWRGRAHRGRW